MKKIKIVQIGMCHEHADGKIAVLKRRSDLFELVGYVDERDFSRSPRLPEPYHPEFYDGLKKLTLDEALHFPGLEAATVEVPNNELVGIAIQCAERGLAMHMDKPAGEDFALYQKLLKICSEKGLPFQMGYMFRGNPAFQFCIRSIREKLIGEVFSLEADMNHGYGGKPYNEYIGKFPGGIMYNLGCHLIDFVVAAMGRPERATPFLKSAPGYPEHVRNNCMAVLEYPHALVSLRSCSREACNTAGRAVRIAGDRGTIRFSPVERFDGGQVELTLTLPEPSGDFPAGEHVLRFPPQRDRYEAQLAEFAGIVRGEKQNPYSYEHDLLVHEVTLAAAGLRGLDG